MHTLSQAEIDVMATPRAKELSDIIARDGPFVIAPNGYLVASPALKEFDDLLGPLEEEAPEGDAIDFSRYGKDADRVKDLWNKVNDVGHWVTGDNGFAVINPDFLALCDLLGLSTELTPDEALLDPFEAFST